MIFDHVTGMMPACSAALCKGTDHTIEKNNAGPASARFQHGALQFGLGMPIYQVKAAGHGWDKWIGLIGNVD